MGTNIWWIKNPGLDLEEGDEIDLDASGKSEYLGLKVTRKKNTSLITEGTPFNWGDAYNGAEATVLYHQDLFMLKVDEADGLLKCKPLSKRGLPTVVTSTSDGACWTASGGSGSGLV